MTAAARAAVAAAVAGAGCGTTGAADTVVVSDFAVSVPALTDAGAARGAGVCPSLTPPGMTVS